MPPPGPCRGQHGLRGAANTAHLNAGFTPALAPAFAPSPSCKPWEPAGAPSLGAGGGAPRGCKAPAEPNDGSKPPQPIGRGCRQMPGTAWGLQRRCSHQSVPLQGGAAPAQPRAGVGDEEAIWDQFADRKRLNLSNKRYRLSPATCSQTLNCSGEGSASLLSGYFHFSSFQPCLGARLLGGRQRTGVTQRTGPVTGAAPTLGDLGLWASSPPCLSPPQSGGNASLLYFLKKHQSSATEAHKSFPRTSIPSTATA